MYLSPVISIFRRETQGRSDRRHEDRSRDQSDAATGQGILGMANSCQKLVIFPQGLWRECRPTNIMLLDSGLQNSERINYHCFIAPPQTFIGLYFYIKPSIVEAMVSPVVMYGCESWTAKKAEYQRTDAFELWHWRKVLRVPQTARRSNLSILKETSPEYSLEGLMLKLKLQYFGHLMRRTDSLEKTLILGGIEGRRRRG